MTLAVDVRVARDGFRLDAAFEVGPRETVALVGPNGAGKSTLVAILAGLLAPDEGTIRLGDRTLDEAERHIPAAERRAGVVFQDLRLFPNLTALENVAFPLRAAGMRREPARRRARDLLERSKQQQAEQQRHERQRSEEHTSELQSH